MRVAPAVAFSALIALPARADGGISAIAVFAPIAILVLLALFFVCYLLPLRMIFRARRLHRQGQLSNATLVRLVSVPVFLGAIGVAGSLLPRSADDMGPYDLQIRLVHFAVSATFLYLGWSTYTRCGTKPPIAANDLEGIDSRS